MFHLWFHVFHKGFMCGSGAERNSIALLIPFLLLNKTIFGLGGLEFCQKMQICVCNLVTSKTHFCQNIKHLPTTKVSVLKSSLSSSPSNWLTPK